MEKSGFFDAEQDLSGNYDREYLAEDFANYFARFISNGVFPNPSTGLQVVAAGTPNMTVSLSPGYAFINGYRYENTSPLTFNIGVADGVLNRKDAIFIRYDKLGRIVMSYKAVGTPSASPQAPAVSRTEDYFDLCVAVINVNAGITAITNSLIEDTRMNSNICGIVTGLITQIDTTTLYNQVQSDLAIFKNVSQADFNKWFAEINAKLTTEPATSLQLQVDAVKKNIDGHMAKTDNPHSVTKEQVGLGNVDNTADTDKPVSTAQQLAIGNAANGALTAAKTFIPNENLLDNSDFTNPVNQRGVTTVTGGGYVTIDRWVHGTGGVTTTVTAQGLKISGGDATYNAPIIQKVVIPMDATYTFSVCTADGNVYSYTGSPFTPGGVATPFGYIYITKFSDIPSVQITVTYGKTETFRWVKLEKGTVATPHVPKGYGAELAECSLYFTRFHINERCTGADVGDGVRVYTTYTIQKMRMGVTPTVTIKNPSYWGSCSGMASEVVGTAGNPTYASVTVRVNGSGAFSAILEISADL